MSKCLLECCVDSVESAIAAQQGGADRLELCGNLVIGGTTPSLALFHQIRKVTDIRIHVLLRPRFGDFLYTEHEMAILKEEMALFREAGADGAVIGCLDPWGRLDREKMEDLLAERGSMSITLHRAFDVCRDPFEALETAKELGINTILTSGQTDRATDGMALLASLVQKAENRIDIMAGAGVDAAAIEKLLPSTGLQSFHMSGKVTLPSGMNYRKEGVSMGLPSLSEFEIFRTEADKVRDARKVLDAYFS